LCDNFEHSLKNFKMDGFNNSLLQSKNDQWLDLSELRSGIHIFAFPEVESVDPFGKALIVFLNIP